MQAILIKVASRLEKTVFQDLEYKVVAIMYVFTACGFFFVVFLFVLST